MSDNLFEDLANRVPCKKDEVNLEHGPKDINLQKFEASADYADSKCIGYPLPDLYLRQRVRDWSRLVFAPIGEVRLKADT